MRSEGKGIGSKLFLLAPVSLGEKEKGTDVFFVVVILKRKIRPQTRRI